LQLKTPLTRSLEHRLHAFLDTLIVAHTPLSSPLSTPLPRGAVPGAGAGLGSGNGARTPVGPADPGNGCVMVVTHEACILALLRVLLSGDEGVEAGVEAGDCEGDYFPILSQDTKGGKDVKDAPNADAGTNADANALSGTATPTSPTSSTSVPPTPFRTHAKLRSLVRTHTSPSVDVSRLCGNTAVCVVRVWWEPEITLGAHGAVRSALRAVGRIEQWGDVEHLEEEAEEGM
jgi:probable phosphoglycerate mutase